MTPPIIRKRTKLDNTRTIAVYGGLHYTRGNKKPHFSITASIKEGHREVAWGCCHAEILQVHPELSDAVAMHLSDIDGMPTHAVENGYYWLSALQGINQWERKTKVECMPIVMDYLRISRDVAIELSERIQNKDEFAAWVETQKARWKAEADACIRKYRLVVYGDAWRGES